MKNILRGGQTSMHSFHMSAQLIFTLVKMALLIILIGDLMYVFGKFDLQDLKEISIYYLAKIFMGLGFNNFEFTFTGRYGDIHHVKASAVVSNFKLIIIKNSFFSAVVHGLWVGFISALVAISGLLYLFNFRGRKLAKEKFIRGGRIVSKSKLKALITKSNLLAVSKLKNLYLGSFFFKHYHLAKIPFPKDAEFLHTIILGSTGTGKTSAILDLIDQIRLRGDRAIIYDKMGALTETYYNPQTDIILNPLDARSKSWSLFNEVRKESDYDYIASAFIPEKKSGGDPFWIEAARRVFSTFAKEIKKENPTITNQEFVDALLRSNHKQIAHFLAGTEASSLISADSEKTSLSILAILSAYVASIKYLHDSDEEKFSIRKWVEGGAENKSQPQLDNGFLFISSKGDQHDSLKPLISTWLDIAVKSLLSVDQNQPHDQEPRRIWIILDEVGSLQALPSLLDGLAQSRQFGGAFVVSMHSISQLKAIYGKDTTDTITSLCRNKLFFSVPDNETADFCSQNLGFQEVEEVKEGISYGANEIRDGVNLSTQKSLKRLVIPSELMFMKRLKAYIKFAGEFPIAQISFAIKVRNKISQKFIERPEETEPKPVTNVLAPVPLKPISENPRNPEKPKRKYEEVEDDEEDEDEESDEQDDDNTDEDESNTEANLEEEDDEENLMQEQGTNDWNGDEDFEDDEPEGDGDEEESKEDNESLDEENIDSDSGSKTEDGESKEENPEQTNAQNRQLIPAPAVRRENNDPFFE